MELTRSVAQSTVPVLMDSTLDNFQGLEFFVVVVCFVGFFVIGNLRELKQTAQGNGNGETVPLTMQHSIKLLGEC